MDNDRDNKNILVVDDQVGIRITLKGILTKRGFNVSVAEDGFKALEEVKKTNFQIIFMDIKMPGMNGVETYVKIKTINPKAKVIMMTAWAVEDDIKRSIREGAYTVLYKPFDMAQILPIISECLEDQLLILWVNEMTCYEDLKTTLADKGFKVMFTKNPTECLQQVTTRKYQIIVLGSNDKNHPDYEMLGKVKEIRPDVGVILISDQSDDEALKATADQKSCHVLRKPFPMEKIVQVIENCLE